MTEPTFKDPAVQAVFDDFPPALQEPLLALRALIFETAEQIPEVGEVTETLKWGQPSYQPSRRKVGSPLRLGPATKTADAYGMFVHCQTNLIDQYRDLYDEKFTFEGKRAITFRSHEAPDREALRHCIALALTYHLKKRHQ